MQYPECPECDSTNVKPIHENDFEDWCCYDCGHLWFVENIDVCCPECDSTNVKPIHENDFEDWCCYDCGSLIHDFNNPVIDSEYTQLCNAVARIAEERSVSAQDALDGIAASHGLLIAGNGSLIGHRKRKRSKKPKNNGFGGKHG